MTQDEIIEMAKQAHISLVLPASERALVAFAQLVAAKEQKKWEDQTAIEIHEAVLEERAACANLCWKNEDDNAFANSYNGKRLDLLCSELIKARGEQA